MHAPSHALRGGSQAQVPASHDSRELQAVPQVPQLAVLDSSATQPRSHWVSPAAQASVHRPRLHTCPSAQAVSQAPQWAASLRVSTHAVSQRVWPRAQAGS